MAARVGVGLLVGGTVLLPSGVAAAQPGAGGCPVVHLAGGVDMQLSKPGECVAVLLPRSTDDPGDPCSPDRPSRPDSCLFGSGDRTPNR